MNNEYHHALKDLYSYGTTYSPRGFKTKELLNYTLTLHNPKERISTLNPLHTRIDYAMAELEWYLSGSNRITDLPEKYQRIWKQFSDDGVHCNSAYGQYIFPRQWKWTIETLKQDNDTRQALININQPYHKSSITKDFPCCIAMQFFIRDSELDMIVNFRSNDINLGWKNDIFTMSALQEILAYKINVPLGTFHIVSNSLHIYERDFKLAEEVLNKPLIENVEYNIPVKQLVKKYKL